MAKPIDIATRSTVAFIETNVCPGASLIEVGSGDGRVAAALGDCGYRVLAIDSDEGLVASARQRGVVTECVSWLDYRGGTVDAVVFTRSLHHISPLHDAVANARDVLHTGGVMLVEDFAFDEIEKTAIDWFLTVIDSSRARRLISPTADEFVTKLLQAEDREAAWRQDHDHDLHSASAMTAAIDSAFDELRTSRVPYLYRYLIPVLPETPAAAAFAQEVFQEEEQLGMSGAIVPIGRRITARKNA